MDYLKLERSKGGFENVLVVTDHFTKYSQAYPTKNQTARTTARVLFDQFISNYFLSYILRCFSCVCFYKTLCICIGVYVLIHVRSDKIVLIKVYVIYILAYVCNF